MKKTRGLTLVILVFMLVVPSLVLLVSNPSATDFDTTKKYTESYDHHDQIWIQSDAEFDAQAAAESWAGDGSSGNPYVITGYIFDCATQPLRIWHTTVHWIFTGNTIDGVGDVVLCGSWIENVTNGAIVGNEIYNRHAGLALSGVSDFKVAENNIHDCYGHGIEVFGPMNDTIIQENTINMIDGAGIYSVTARDSIVKDNVISNIGNIGIALMTESYGCTVTRNTITHCESYGMMILQADEGLVADNTISHVDKQGIYMVRPEYSEISNNTISNVDGNGMRLFNANFTDIFENDIADCAEDGFRLNSGMNTTIHWNSVTNVSEYAVNLESACGYSSVKYNTFMDNGVTSQICDDGTSNIVSHNFYDDWAAPDANADGFVDSPYVFEGGSSTQDEFPLAEAGIVPTTETNTTTENQMAMDLILIAGAVGAIVLVASVLMLKRR